MLDVKHCDGCREDFYNGKNPYGVETCWMRKSATLAERLLVPVDLAPPYLHIKPESIPTCYKRDRYVTVKPEAVDSKGYWRG